MEIFNQHIHLKKKIIGNIYKLPRDINANYEQFIDEFTHILDVLAKYKCDVIIAGDFNIDLLKVHEKTLFSDYLDMITANGFFPQIELPTRLSDRRGTLIDNFLYKWSQHIPTITAGILISNIFYHLPYFISINDINIKTQSVPKNIQITQRGDDNIRKFKTELSKANICSKIKTDLHANPNENYDIVNQILADLNIPINIYIDLSNAFDNLDHSILLHKLNHYGINGVAFKLLKCFLSNRKQHVHIGSSRSKYTPIELGVPQGSILGPLLFIMYINDITSSSDLLQCMLMTLLYLPP